MSCSTKFNHDDILPIEVLKVDSSSKPIMKCIINGTCMDLEFDTGSSLTVVSQSTVSSVGLSLTLLPSSRTLMVANGMSKPVKGYAEVDVKLNDKRVSGLRLHVVDGYFPSLFGRSWIEQFFGENWLTTLMTVSNSVSVVRAVESGPVDLDNSRSDGGITGGGA